MSTFAKSVLNAPSGGSISAQDRLFLLKNVGPGISKLTALLRQCFAILCVIATAKSDEDTKSDRDMAAFANHVLSWEVSHLIKCIYNYIKDQTASCLIPLELLSFIIDNSGEVYIKPVFDSIHRFLIY